MSVPRQHQQHQHRYSMPPPFSPSTRNNGFSYNTPPPQLLPPPLQPPTNKLNQQHRPSYPNQYSTLPPSQAYQQRPQQAHPLPEMNGPPQYSGQQQKRPSLGATLYLTSLTVAAPLMTQFFTESPTSPGLSTHATAFALRAYLESFLFYIGYDPSTGTPPQTFISLNEHRLGRELGISPEKARGLYLDIWNRTTPNMEVVCQGIVGMENKLGSSEEVVKALRYLFQRNHGLTPEEMLGGGGKVVGVYGESILDEKVQAGLIRNRKGVKGEAGGGVAGGGGGWKKFWRFGKGGGKKEGEATQHGTEEQETGDLPIASKAEERALNGKPVGDPNLQHQHRESSHHTHNHHHRQRRHSDQPLAGHHHRQVQNTAGNQIDEVGVVSTEQQPLEKRTPAVNTRRSRSIRQQERAPPLRDDRDPKPENVMSRNVNTNTMSGALIYTTDRQEQAQLPNQQAPQNSDNNARQSSKAHKAHHYRRKSASDVGAAGENARNSVGRSYSQKKHHHHGFQGEEEAMTPDGEGPDVYRFTDRNAETLQLPGGGLNKGVDSESSRMEGDDHGQSQDPFVDPGMQQGTSGTGEKVRRKKDKDKDKDRDEQKETKRKRHRKSERERNKDKEREEERDESERPKEAHDEAYELNPPPGFGDGGPETGTVESTPTKRKREKKRDKERGRDEHAEGEREKDRKRRHRKEKDRERERERRDGEGGKDGGSGYE